MPDATAQPRIPRDHGFHPLRVADVVRETAEANSIVLEITDELRDAFAYKSGQFVTFRLGIDGQQVLRSYSMSSSPDVGDRFQVTVKRVPDGVVSNWLIDNVSPGDTLETTCPAGHFCLDVDDPQAAGREVVTFAGGSGITPVFAILKTALATTTRRARLLYANRDRNSVIFAAELDELLRRHADRLDVVHHLDVESGFVDDETVGRFVDTAADADYYVCGPGPFMTIVEDALQSRGVVAERIHIERFTPRDVEPEQQEAPTTAGDTPTIEVTIELDGKVATTTHRAGTTLLQTARQAGLTPPFSCEAGDCATCMAKLEDGSATMFNNNALTDDEVAEGWVLTCQAVPTTPTVRVVYGFD